MTLESNGIYARKTYGQERAVCPECSHKRSKSRDKCLAINHDEGVWFCHHCGWKGSLNKKPMDIKEIIQKPKQEVKTELPQDIIDWFGDRGISEDTRHHRLVW
jgi:twinkle protein